MLNATIDLVVDAYILSWVTNGYVFVLICCGCFSDEARATIPSLTLQDINPHNRELDISILTPSSASVSSEKVVKRGGEVWLLHDEPSSSGVLYVDLALDFSGIDHRDLPLLPLFTR